MARRITWRSGKTNGVYWGEVVFPDNLGHAVTVKATANEPAKALARSASMAEKLVNNPAVQALLPPGAGPALNAAAKVLRSKAVGKALKFARGMF